VIDEALAGVGGGDQGGGAGVVDGAGLAAGGLVDLSDRLVAEQLGGFELEPEVRDWLGPQPSGCVTAIS
jgi:hypothetical protein